MDKIVALNSGGFDSIVMLHSLREAYPDAEIHCLYFAYGQLNDVQAERCALDAAIKLRCVFHQTNLPKFSWTNSKFFQGEREDESLQYLEMRNMIFLSYALSLCESIGATKLYMAALSAPNPYKDATPEFLEDFCILAENTVGVTLCTPFIGFSKLDLAYAVRQFGITSDQFFSCDSPELGQPCGKCLCCQEVEAAMELASSDIPL